MTRSRNGAPRPAPIADPARDDLFDLPDDELEAAVRAEIGEEYDDYALLTAYLAGDLSLADCERIEERLRRDSKFRALAEPLIMAWNIPRPLDRRENLLDRRAAERGWQKLRKRIELEEQGLHTRTWEEKRARKRHLRAAVFGTIALVITGWLGSYIRPPWLPVPSAYVHTDAPPSEQRIAQLPDQTEVTLTPGSHLAYAFWFSASLERTLNLNGEATFTVTPRRGAPLVVAGAGVEVTANRARFTVLASDALSVAYVTVHDGTAAVRARTVDGAHSVVLLLHAGETARVGPGLNIAPVDASVGAPAAKGANDREAPNAAHEAATDTAHTVSGSESAPAPGVETITRRLLTEQTDFVGWPRELASGAPALADSIEQTFGQRPRTIAFGGRDTLDVVFWNPVFWRDNVQKELPGASQPIAFKAGKLVANYVWTTFARDAGIKYMRISFIRLRRESYLGVIPSRLVPAQEVVGHFPRAVFQTGSRAIPAFTSREL